MSLSNKNTQASNGNTCSDKLEEIDYSNEAFNNCSFPTFTPLKQSGSSKRTNGDTTTKQNLNLPGTNFQSKKKIDEFERMQATLLDKNWNLSKYGDPLIKENT